MNSEELTVLLARIQVLDNRQVDELTIQAWEPLVEDLDYSDAVQAVITHFRDSTAYLQPAHIRALIRSARQRQGALTMSPRVEDCGNHRRLPDGTCLYCEARPDAH